MSPHLELMRVTDFSIPWIEDVKPYWLERVEKEMEEWNRIWGEETRRIERIVHECLLAAASRFRTLALSTPFGMSIGDIILVAREEFLNLRRTLLAEFDLITTRLHLLLVRVLQLRTGPTARARYAASPIARRVLAFRSEHPSVRSRCTQHGKENDLKRGLAGSPT
jgi:hypothetical protein